MPETLKIIGSEAFCYPNTDCEIEEFIIPPSVIYVGEEIVNADVVYVLNPSLEFDGCPFKPNPVVYGYVGSTTAEICAKWDFTFAVIDE